MEWLNKLKLSGVPIYSGLSTKQKKTANLFLGGLASLGVVTTLFWALESSTPPPPPEELKPETPADTVNAPGHEKIDPELYWRVTESKRIDELEAFANKVKSARGMEGAGAPATPTSNGTAAPTQAGSLQAQATAEPGQSSVNAASPTQPQATPQPVPAAASNQPSHYPRQSRIAGPGGIPDPMQRPVSGNAPGAHLGMQDYPPGAPNSVNGLSGILGASGGAAGGYAPAGIVSIKVASAAPQSGTPESKTGAPAADAAQWNVKRNYMPMGFVRAKLIGGIDAATGGQAQQDPQPMMFMLMDDSILPNGWRGRTRNCFAVAAGAGDISSERVMARVIRLGCVKKNGDVLETDVTATVYGEDGKNGMRGRLVTKQGQVLANAAAAGIASGIGKGFGNTGTTVSQSPLGVTTQQATDAKTVLNNSMAQGFGNAMDRLAQYWIERADKMHPVIEIDANREIDIAFIKGVSVPAPPGEGDDELDQAPSGRHLNRARTASTLMGANE